MSPDANNFLNHTSMHLLEKIAVTYLRVLMSGSVISTDVRALEIDKIKFLVVFLETRFWVRSMPL